MTFIVRAGKPRINEPAIFDERSPGRSDGISINPESNFCFLVGSPAKAAREEVFIDPAPDSPGLGINLVGSEDRGSLGVMSYNAGIAINGLHFSPLAIAAAIHV